MAPSAVPAAARCPRHPEAYAVDACVRCGTFVCGDCLELKPSGAYCEDCAQRMGREQKGSRLAVTAFVLAAVGLAGAPLAIVFFGRGILVVVSVACMPLGMVGFLLGGIDLVRIFAGRAPRSGRRLDLWALALGSVSTLITLVLLYVVAADLGW